MKPFAWLLRGLRWLGGSVVALGLVLVLAGAGLWWWAGQEGSLEWTLERVARGQPLEREGVRGSIRSGWRIDRLAWEQDGLRVEARDIALEWQPLALLNRSLRLDEVRIGRLLVVDQRPKDDEPLTLPDSLALPWRVTVDEVAVGAFSYDGATRLEGGALAGRYAFDGLRHQLELKSLQFAGGNYQGEARLLAAGDMTLEARLTGALATEVPGSGQPVQLRFEAGADGPLRDFEARAQLRVARPAAVGGELPRADARARVTLLEAMPVPLADAKFQALDLAAFWPQAPRTLLSGQLQVAPAGAAGWRLQADLRNGAAGPWDAGRLPLAQLRAAGEWRDGMALVRSLQAEVGRGKIEGEGDWQGEGWRFAGRIDMLDPAQLHSALAALPLSGPLELNGQGQAVAFDLDLQAQGAPRRAPARRRAAAKAAAADPVEAALAALELRQVRARGRWNDGRLALPQLQVRTSDARLTGELEADIKALSGNGRIELVAPGLRSRAEGALARTRGQGQLQLDLANLALAQRWLARWPGLDAALAPGRLVGRGDLQLAWQGGWEDPSLQGQLRASGIAPVAAKRGAEPPWRLREGQLRLDGRLRQARVDLSAQAEQGQRLITLLATGTGGQQRGGDWRGALATLRLQAEDPALGTGAWQLETRQPVGWRFGNSGFEVAAGEAVLRAPARPEGAAGGEALLAWGPVRQQGGQLTTTGSLRGLPMGWLELVGGGQLAGSGLSGDLVFDANWDAQLGDTVRLQASLDRVSGDLGVAAESSDGHASRVAAGVREARVQLTSQGEELTLALRWNSARAGRADGELRTRLARSGEGWSWPEDAPLAGHLRAALPRLGVWSLLAPPGWRLRGALVADVEVSGTRNDPVLRGPLRADGLALRSVVDGIELRNGRLRAQLEGRRLVLQEFVLRGADDAGGAGGGSLVAFGEGEWTADGPQLQVQARVTQLRASIHGDRQLTVSGEMAARMDGEGTDIQGKLVVDRALIRLPDQTAPRLGEDVVVRNVPGVPATEDERRQRPPPTDGGRAVKLAVAIDLGEQFRVQGMGVDTRVAGTLQLEGQSLAEPRLTGVIRTVGGKYDAYGQKMDIERGELRFTGPLNNPALDVLAIRPNTEQRVGVLISGRAQAPHIELYSEAGLSQAETLSWLVLGRSSAGGGAETALLQRAAGALLAGRRGTGRGIAGALGLDDVSLSGDGANGAVVRVGKRFADNFYAAYERSLSGALGTLYIFYDVSSRLTVRAEAGERTGLDLIFTFIFDRVP